MKPVSTDLLSRLLQAQGPALVLYARQWCRSPEDVVQEAFVELMRQATAPSHPTAWLYRVVRNRALNAGRSTARRDRHESEAAQQRKNWFDDNSVSQIDADEVARQLQQLPAEQREVIVARIWGGLSFEAIAELVESSSSTVFRRYQAGLTTLRTKLEVACPNTPRSPT